MSHFSRQLSLFLTDDIPAAESNSTNFVDNMKLPVHRWFRYSAGFSAEWAGELIRQEKAAGKQLCVLDPFAGSATTLLAAEDHGVESYGLEKHPYISRVAQAKLLRRTDATAYHEFSGKLLNDARLRTGSTEGYPSLILKCYHEEALLELDQLRRTLEAQGESSAEAELTWLTLSGILRKVSHVGTANWQYVLPKKSKKVPLQPFAAFEMQREIVYRDMLASQQIVGPAARLLEADARTCADVPPQSVNLVITSPPYPNNYDYADATRLEMSFFGEIEGWGDLQQAVRQHLVRSCSQHVTEKNVELDQILASPELSPLQPGITNICRELAKVRLTKGGRKTYHLMVACYFLDLAQVWLSLRRVCASPCKVCFVIGDSAPYGVYVPVMEWMGTLALAAGFREFRFEQVRQRNHKWKNRKHRVPLCEGRLWVEG